MRLATQRDGTSDGRLLLVSRDARRALAPSGSIAVTLQSAIERWDEIAPALADMASALDAGSAPQSFDLDPATLTAPLPRAWQWLDGSAFPEHGRLMQQAFNLPAIDTDRPLMYQGMSDRFLGPRDDVPLPSEADGIDFEGEFGVIVDAVPMGTSAADALGHIKLLVQINDWSLRTIAPIEMKTGFGWVQAKPACSMAPFAVTPDTLGALWSEGRNGATLTTHWNGVRFGAVAGAEEMAFGFHELVAHAARTRDLVAGTVIGSGTLSTADHALAGSSCISERRAIDAIAGRTPTPFLSFGDRVGMEATLPDGSAPFGAIDQRVVQAA